ncbi:MAG: ethylbenzene dehydrogenase-related protein, partial [candidate division NC10 bacterium]
MLTVRKLPWITVFTILILGVGLFALSGPALAQQNVLVAKKIAAGPTLDGTMKDIWNQALAFNFKVVGGRNLPGGSTEGTLRALYTSDMVYFLFQYKDPTESVRRSPWQKQADGTWKKLRDPEDKGGDNNVYYEDKFAVIWNISSPAFEQRGCLSACHTGEGKAFGNKYTKDAGERLDMWHWKGVRTGPVGQ